MNMKITRCKLSKKVQSDLLNYFIAEVTARNPCICGGPLMAKEKF